LHRDDAIRLIEQLQSAVRTIKDLRQSLDAVMGQGTYKESVGPCGVRGSERSAD
jgi:hypothetical protein